MVGVNLIDDFIYQIEQNHIEQQLREQFENRNNMIKAQLFIKGTYAFIIFVLALYLILNRACHFTDGYAVELFSHVTFLTYVFIMECAYKRHY